MSRGRQAFWGGLLGGALGPIVARLGRKVGGLMVRLLSFAALGLFGYLYRLTGSVKGALVLLAVMVLVVVALVSIVRSGRRPHLPHLPANPYGPDPGRTVLYRFYDDRNELLYVGIAEDPSARERQHAADRSKAHWWWRVHHRVDVVYATRREAKDAETAAIRGELGDPRPWYNVAEARG